MTTIDPSRPLHAIKVVDFTTIVLGPLATLCLADMGAEVVKVEAPEGDGIRNSGTLKSPGMSSIFLGLNRGKKCIAVDLKSEAARGILHRLTRWCDVIVHNMRPDAARRLGLDFDTLRKINPRIIHCSASGFSEASPRAGEPAVDDVIQAATGLASLFADSVAEPRYVPALIADKVSGLLLCQGILGALLSRAATGEGMAVAVPMRESIGCFNLIEHLGGYSFVPECGPAQYGRLTTPHRRPLRTLDGYISITPYSKKQWQSFFQRAGRTDLVDDPRITDPERRNAEIGDLYALLASILLDRTSREWTDMAREAGIPVSPVVSLEDLAADLADSGHLMRFLHPTEGETLAVGPLVRLGDGTTRPSGPARHLGQDNRVVMSAIGFSASEIDAFEAERVIVSVGVSR
jgi:crotonobetainyl-CoA:carnitine CoA-transferase CaiB-like acyl-CoA transferase